MYETFEVRNQEKRPVKDSSWRQTRRGKEVKKLVGKVRRKRLAWIDKEKLNWARNYNINHPQVIWAKQNQINRLKKVPLDEVERKKRKNSPHLAGDSPEVPERKFTVETTMTFKPKRVGADQEKLEKHRQFFEWVKERRKRRLSGKLYRRDKPKFRKYDQKEIEEQDDESIESEDQEESEIEIDSEEEESSEEEDGSEEEKESGEEASGNGEEEEELLEELELEEEEDYVTLDEFKKILEREKLLREEEERELRELEYMAEEYAEEEYQGEELGSIEFPYEEEEVFGEWDEDVIEESELNDVEEEELKESVDEEEEKEAPKSPPKEKLPQLAHFQPEKVPTVKDNVKLQRPKLLVGRKFPYDTKCRAKILKELYEIKLANKKEKHESKFNSIVLKKMGGYLLDLRNKADDTKIGRAIRVISRNRACLIDDFKRYHTGSQFRGQYSPLGMDGAGTYTLSYGPTFEGYVVDGKFEGYGRMIYPNGGWLEGMWSNGVLCNPKYVFADGLAFEPYDWRYCQMPDRRFQTEIVHGLRPDPQLANDHPARAIPPNCLDAGEGFYDPKRKFLIHPVKGNVIRIPSRKENKWILEHCRKAWDENVPFQRDMYENWFPGTKFYLDEESYELPECMNEFPEVKVPETNIEEVIISRTMAMQMAHDTAKKKHEMWEIPHHELCKRPKFDPKPVDKLSISISSESLFDPIERDE